jgi:small GTP-binding protein
MEGQEFRLKFVLVGDSGVGKSCVLLRFVDDTFSPSFMTTIGIDFKVKTLTIGDEQVKVQIWDTAGQERFKTITNAYYVGADAIFVVYSVIDKESFNHLEYWIEEVDKRARTDAVVIIVGNKSDDTEKRQVDETSAKDYATKRGYLFWETSASSGKGVHDLFTSVAQKVYAQKKGIEEKEVVKSVDLRDRKEEIKKKGCC